MKNLRRDQISNFSIILFLSFIVFMFQNCGGGMEYHEGSTSGGSNTQLTKEDIYIQKMGPNGQSMDDILVNRCLQCHGPSPLAGYGEAQSWFELSFNNPIQNYLIIKNVRNPVTNTTFTDLTSETNGVGSAPTRSVATFMVTHKTRILHNNVDSSKNITSSELVYAQDFVDY